MADNYDVIAQRPTTTGDLGGPYEPAYEITYRTKPNRIVGRITVPESQYAPDEVASLLKAAAENAEAIHTL